jgi:MFS family permease
MQDSGSKVSGAIASLGKSPCSWACNRHWLTASLAGCRRSCATVDWTGLPRVPSSRFPLWRRFSPVFWCRQSLAVIGLLGFLFAPLSTVWLWAVIQGIGQGGLIAVAMTIIVLRSGDAHIASHLSGMAQCVGYMLAAIGPLLVGLIHSLTGSYSATAILFVLLGFGVAIFGWGAGSATHVKARTIQV